MSDYWDQYDDTDGDGGGFEYVKFNDVGDSLKGRITALDEGEDFNGNPCPMLTLSTETGRKIWTASQAVAKRILLELRPQVGWEIEVRYSGQSESKPGRAPAKLFTIEVLSRDTEAAPVAAAPASGADL
jgi:hypothetical protein